MQQDLFLQYQLLANYYDRFMQDVDYAALADFYEQLFAQYLNNKPHVVLDLGCGSGVLTLELARRGYEMIGVDCSAEMLAMAQAHAAAKKTEILWVQQDMRELSLYGSVGAVICSLDCVNYLLLQDALVRTFDGVFRFLDPGGLFLFDVNTVYKFEHAFAGQTYVYEQENVYCVWENVYHPRTRRCDFVLDFFEKEKNGMYSRKTEVQTQRAWSDRTLQNTLHQSGFAIRRVCSDLQLTPAGKTDLRHYYVCQKPMGDHE